MKYLSEMMFVIFAVALWVWLTPPKLLPDNDDWAKDIQAERDKQSFKLGMEYYRKLDAKYGDGNGFRQE